MALTSIADILREKITNNRAVKRFKTLWTPTVMLLDGQGKEAIGDVRDNPGAHTVLKRLQDLLIESQTVRVVDSNNSTIENLGNGGIFTGDWKDSIGYISAIIQILTNQDSAANGFQIQTSTDGINPSHIHEFSVTNNSPNGAHYVFTLTGRYYRVIYTNGATPQTSFNLSSTLSKCDATHSHTHPVEFSFDGNHESQLMRSVNAGKKPNGDYVNAEYTAGGNPKVSIEEFDDAISSNNNTQLNITQLDSSGLEINRLPGNAKSFEDINFVTGESPVVLDCNGALGRNAIRGFILNDGPGNFTVAFSDDGISYGDEITRKSGEFLNFDNDNVDSIRITWISDSAYRVAVK